MTARTTKPRVRRERRIIERPRLIKLLDESEARIILLLAPAGYGKTTLARQWAKTLNGAIWVSLTPAHRDVARLAAEISVGIDELGGSTEFAREYVRAQSNPQAAAAEIGRTLTREMNAAGLQWLVIDDWHEVADATEVNTMLEMFAADVSARLLVSSRVRPPWLTTRRAVYGEVMVVDSSKLAMTHDEATEVLGRRQELADVAKRAQGWPAVLGLAAASESAAPPTEVLPSAIYRYLVEELFQAAPRALRDDLITLALLPDLEASTLRLAYGRRSSDVIEEAHERGFLAGSPEPELHPLLREFLLLKLRDETDAACRITSATKAAVKAEKWEHALDLVLRFSLVDLIDDVLTEAMLPLVRSGHLGTLAAFAAQMRKAPTFPPATVDLIDAELAFREGQFELASDLGERALLGLSPENRLRSRANTIIGHSHYLLASYDAAEAAFMRARAAQSDETDRAEAIHGLVLTQIFGERDGVEPVMQALGDLRHESPTHLLRHVTAELTRRRFAEGLAEMSGLEEALHTLPLVRDPRARTSFTYTLAYDLGVRADYEEATRYLDMLFEDIDLFDLGFARPYADWARGMVSLGLRKFGEAERAIQAVEDAGTRAHDRRHGYNARLLRARLLLQTGQPQDALRLVRRDPTDRLIPSWVGEHVATRALILACLGDRSAVGLAARAVRLTHAIDVRVLAAAAVAVAGAAEGNATAPRELMDLAARIGSWDGVVCAVRSSPPLADAIAADEEHRSELEDLYQRSGDRSLARKAGLRTRATRAPQDLLSPRELEVLGLIARGLRNREISEALFIADSTTKVHVRHIFEKLGVRSRAEAVARYERLTDAK